MKNIENLTLANLLWLRDKAIPTSKTRITQESLDVVMRGRAMILGFPYSPVGCFSCSARGEFKVSASELEQHQQAILDQIHKLESQAEDTASKAPDLTEDNVVASIKPKKQTKKQSNGETE